MIKTMDRGISESASSRVTSLSSLGFDWIAAGLSAWVVGGLYLDGWAHEHGRVDSTFFTPWHAVLYSGVFVLFIFLGIHQLRNMSRDHAWQRALPAGYRLSLAGAFLFLFGGGLDFAWHTVFGIEVNLETLLSPTHLLLATSGVLMVSGPVRSAWQKPLGGAQTSRRAFWPMLVSLMLVLSILTFFTQFVHPFHEIFAASDTNASIPRSDIFMMNVDGMAQTRLTIDPQLGGWGAAWSPDGSQVVFSRISGGSPNDPVELYWMNADGSHLTQLTHNQQTNYLPAWSPDGKKIAFISQDGQRVHSSDVYLVDLDGSSEVRLTDTDAQEYGVSWSPDGRQIAFGSLQDGTWQIYLMNSDGSHPTQLGGAGGGNAPAWSPDGTRIAFNSDRYGNDEIFVVNSDGSNLHRLTDNKAQDDNPSWAPDSSRITFASDRDGNTNIFVMQADGSSPTNLSQDTGVWNGVPSWSPDGRKILYSTQGNPERPAWMYQSLGIASVLLQTALLLGVVLLAVRHGNLPFGAMTALIGVNSAMMTIFHDRYTLLPAALLAGILADLLLYWLRPTVKNQPRFALFAFSFPVIYYSLYYLTVQLTQGIAWTIHLWLGSIFLAGITGLLVSFLLVSPLRTAGETASSQG